MYTLSDNDVGIVGEFLRQRLKLPEDSNMDQQTTWLRDKYLSWKLDELVAISDPQTEKDKRLHTAAAKFIASCRTNDFIEQANVEKGATPNTRDVAEEYMRQCSILGAHDLNPGLRRALEGSSRRNTATRCVQKWGRRFRRQWCFGFGSLSAREPMADSEVIDKAWLFTLGAGVLSYCDARLTSR